MNTFHFYQHDPEPFDLYAVMEDSYGRHVAPPTCVYLGSGEGDNVADAWNYYRHRAYNYPVKSVQVDSRLTAANNTWHFTYHREE